MKDFVNNESQNKVVEDFRNSILNGNMDSFLIRISIQMSMNMVALQNAKVQGITISETNIYKSHLPVFHEIAKKSINKFDSINVLGFSNNDIEKIKTNSFDKSELAKKLLDNLGIEIDEKDTLKDKNELRMKIITGIMNKLTPNIIQENNDFLFFGHKEFNQILNGIEKYESINRINEVKENLEDKEYTSLGLYRDAFEIYMKVLKELYRKVHKMKKNPRNADVCAYFQENHPILWDSQYDLLRNDVSHLNFDVRDKYSIDRIDSERNTILLKAMTGVIARNLFLNEYFSESMSVILNFGEEANGNAETTETTDLINDDHIKQ